MRHPVFLGLMVAMLLGLPAAASTQTDLTREQQEEFLRTAEIVSFREGDRTDLRAFEQAARQASSSDVTLSDGSVTHDAHVQNADIFEREFIGSLGPELNFRDSYKYNIAAYLLNKSLGLDRVPVTVERRVEGRASSVTWAIDDVKMTEWERIEQKTRSSDPRGWASQMFILRMFDQLISNTDRNGGNVIITNDWRIWLTDHTRAFRTNKGLRTPEDLEWCDRTLLTNLREVDESSLRELLSEYLTNTEIEALASRADQIVQHFDRRIAELGEGAVLFTLPQ